MPRRAEEEEGLLAQPFPHGSSCVGATLGPVIFGGLNTRVQTSLLHLGKGHGDLVAEVDQGGTVALSSSPGIPLLLGPWVPHSMSPRARE